MTVNYQKASHAEVDIKSDFLYVGEEEIVNSPEGNRKNGVPIPPK